jgi:integrase
VELPQRNGKRQRHGGGGHQTAREAADARADAIHRHKAGTLPDVDSARMTLAQWLPRWLADRTEAGELRDTTAATYEQLTRTHLLPKLGHLRLADLRGTTITCAYRELLGERETARRKAEQANSNRKIRFGVPPPLGPTTIARAHAVLSGCLRDAVKEGILPHNPATNAKLPKRERHKVRPWTPEALGLFLRSVKTHRLYPVFVLAAFTGLRRGELLGLQWPDVDLDGGRLTVARQRVVLTARGRNEVVVHDEAKTAAGQRAVWLDQATVDTLRRWRKQQNEERLALGPDYSDPGVWLFTWEDGTPYHPEYVTKTFARLARRHGLPPAKLHGLRHYRAASLISVGEEITVVSKLLGHASVAVTANIYGSLFEVAGRAAGEKAAALVSLEEVAG